MDPQKRPEMLAESLSILFFYYEACWFVETRYFALLTTTFASYFWVEQTRSRLCVTVVLEKVASLERHVS